MTLEKQLGELYPEMKETFQSEQYRLSEIIIQQKIRRDKTPDEMADMLGIDLSLYLKLELADTGIGVEVYEKALAQLTIV